MPAHPRGPRQVRTFGPKFKEVCRGKINAALRRGFGVFFRKFLARRGAARLRFRPGAADPALARLQVPIFEVASNFGPGGVGAAGGGGDAYAPGPVALSGLTAPDFFFGARFARAGLGPIGDGPPISHILNNRGVNFIP